MDLKVDEALFKDACSELFEKSCIIGGEYDTFDAVQRNAIAIWSKFLSSTSKEAKKRKADAAAATSAANSAGSDAPEEISETRALAWRLLRKLSVDTAEGLEATCKFEAAAAAGGAAAADAASAAYFTFNGHVFLKCLSKMQR